MFANVRRSLFEADDGLVRIARYELRQRLGTGAMGQVHLAFDPRLRREVALKVLTVETEAAATVMTREARALARLEHPGIVRVFDVGSSELGLFIVMERLEGIALDAWARSRGPSIRQRLRVLVEVARALAAAHEAGLVHRDVKPQNVVIEPDGRAVVVDFGLAANVDIASPAAGTPAYMPPEQFEGGPATPSADQYAWAVMAWELLYGSRPFAEGEAGTILERKQAGHLPERPPDSREPAGVQEILRRGLAPDPAGRWASMGALLQALERVVRPGRRWRWGLGIAAVGACAAAVGLAPPTRDVEDICAPEVEWGEEGRSVAREAVVRGGDDLGREVWAQLSPRIDAAVGDYADSRRRVCSGNRARHDAVACLRGWSKRFEAVASSLQVIDPADVPDAVAWALELGDPARCEDPDAASILGPAAPSRIREEVERVRGELERAKTMDALRSTLASRGLLEDLAVSATQLGFKPLVAEILLQRGRIYQLTGEVEKSLVDLERAHNTALRSHHDYVRALSAANLAEFFVLSTGDTQQAAVWLRRARAVDVSRWPNIEVACLEAEALLAEWGEGESIPIQVRAVEVAASIGPGDALLAKERLGQLLLTNRRFSEGYELASEVLEARQQSLGAHHRSHATLMFLLGGAASELGRYEESQRLFARAVEIHRRVSGDHSAQLASMLVAQAKGFNLSGDWERAQGALEAAAASLAATPEHQLHTTIDLVLGETRLGERRPADALELFSRALVATEQRFGVQSEDAAWALSDVGRARLELGEFEDAHSALAQAWALLEPHQSQPAREFSVVLFALARASAADGGPHAQARAFAQRAMREAVGTDPASATLRARIDAWLLEQFPG